MKTTDPGFVNRNGQINLGITDPKRHGSVLNNYVYVMHCPDCNKNYGANGCDIHLRKCPFHDGGMPGLPLTPDEELLDNPIQVEGSSELPIKSIEPQPDQTPELERDPAKPPSIQVADEVPAPSSVQGQIGPIRRLIKRAPRIKILKQVAGRIKKLW